MPDLAELTGLADGLAAAVRATPPTDPRHAALQRAEAKARAMLASLHWGADELGAADACLDQAIALGGPDGWRVRQAVLLPRILLSSNQIMAARQRLEQRLRQLLETPLAVADPLGEIGWSCFLLAYHGVLDNGPLHRLFHRVLSHAAPSLDWEAPHCRQPRRAGRGRVGFISWHLNPHTIARMFLGLVEAFDGDGFETTLFTFAGQDGAVTPLPGKQVVRLPAELDAARQTIAAAELDVLVYLDLGMDYLTLYLAHARLAPLQAVLWGHPDTTGLPNIDLFLSPDCMEPDDGETHYSERLVRLPGPTVVYPRPALPAGPPPDRHRFGLPAEGTLFLCPQTPQKFHPDFDAPLRRILDGCPGSHLVLTAGWNTPGMERLRQRLAGDRPELLERIVLVGTLDRPAFIQLFQVCDVALDPLHYSGGNTSLEGFATGIPIVTWPGRFMRARHTYGFYRLMGVMDGVARDVDHYVELAIGLGRDPARRQALRQRLAQAATVLYDDHSGLEMMEALFRAEIAARG